MSYPFGITGIGYNPYMSGLGTYGLSTGGSYSSYADPTMMGMTGGMGMMGMYNPAFMGQMAQVYQNIEKSQLEHSSAMHELLQQNKVDAYKADDRALFQKSMEDAGLNGLIVNLAEKIREGDADGICEEFDKLKLALYQKHNTYLRANSDRLDPKECINNIIEGMYTQIISKKVGETVSLRSDIKKYGETAFMRGFNEKFFGKQDYHNNYTEETLSYLFGTRIDNKAGKDRMDKIGGGFGRVAEAGTATLAGYGTGIGLAAVGAAMSSTVREYLGTDFVKDEAGNVIKEGGKKLKNCSLGNGLVKTAKIGKWAALTALAADVIWQITRD